MARTEYWIAESNLDALRKEIGRLARKAKRLGLPEPSLTVTSDTRPAEYVARYEVTPESAPEAVPVTVGYTQVRVMLDAESPTLDGWKWVATIDHKTDLPGGENLVDAADPQEAVKYENVPASCEHCGYDRQRKWTYVLDHEDGTRVQVGRTCLKDFIPGANDPHRVADYAQVLFATLCSLGSDCDDAWAEPMGGVRTSHVVLTEEYLAWVASVMRVDGWMSRGLAWERYSDTSRSTATAAWDWMHNPSNNYEVVRARREREPTTEDKARAMAALEWARDELTGEADNEYLDNLHAACQPTGITSRRIGLVASALVAHDRAVADAERAARRAESKDLPNFNGRTRIVGRIIKLDLQVNDFGSREVMTVEHEDGWRVWGTQPKTLYEAKKGDVVAFDAKVEPSDRDSKFGFFKRPTKAEIVEAAQDQD